jgi:hypothetical protein
MKIGELAERTGLAPSKIRFYEAHGLIAPVQRQANGIRGALDETIGADRAAARRFTHPVA